MSSVQTSTSDEDDESHHRLYEQGSTDDESHNSHSVGATSMDSDTGPNNMDNNPEKRGSLRPLPRAPRLSSDGDDAGTAAGTTTSSAAGAIRMGISPKRGSVPSAFRHAQQQQLQQKQSSSRSLSGSLHKSAHRPTSTTDPLTPLSAMGSKKRLSAKLADRFSRFEGETLSPLPPAISAIMEMNSDSELSPLHVGSGHPPKRPSSSASSNNYPPDQPLTLSAITRKRSVRASLQGRVKVFDSPKKQAARLLLSPKEVRQLVASTSTRISGIKQNFEQQRQRVRDQTSRKERQRQMLLQLNANERRQQWEATRAQFNDDELNNIDRFFHGCYNANPELVYQPVRAASLDFDLFIPPDHGSKTEEQRQLILDMVDRNFVFTEFRHFGKARTNESTEALIQAFEPVAIHDMGHVLWHQDHQHQHQHQQQSMKSSSDGTILPTSSSPKHSNSKKDDGQAFYIIQEGAVSFHADGVSVGKLGKTDGFGEQSLLHPSPSPVTVSVALDSNHQGKKGAQLLKLDPNTYRGLLHMFSHQAEQEKRQALLQVDFLKDILDDHDGDDDGGGEYLLHRLASLMTRVEFTKDQVFDAPEDVTFFVLQSGEMHVKNNSGALDAILKTGDYFGERALIGSLPRRSLVTTHTTMTACSDSGVFFKIDRAQMETILGPSRLQNLMDIHRISKTSLWKTSAKLSKKPKAIMADHIVQHKLEAPNNTVLTVQAKDEPALYVVQEGTVTVSYDDHNKRGSPKQKVVTLEAGDVFGQDQLEERNDAISGKTRFCRTGGLKAETIQGKSAVIGVLKVQEENKSSPKKDSSSFHNSKSPIPSSSVRSESSTGSKNNATLDLREKVRQVVKDGLTLADLEKISLLGEGQFGEVWLVAADIFHTGDPNLRQKFALKSQHRRDELRGKDAVDAIRREIDIMNDINHSQVVDLVQTFEDEDSIYMLMGLIPGGELWDRVYQEEAAAGDWNSGLSEEHAKFYTMVVADTLGFIHSRQYIYRDLKPENIMIDADGYPVIVDFGCAKYCPDKTFTFCGTPNYVAPEIIKNAGHSRGVDHWALGVTLYEMITGENPFYFDGMDQVSLYDCICQEPHYALTTEKGHSSELIDLVDRLLEKDPNKRLGMLAGGMGDILRHAWFDELNLVRVQAKRWPAPWKPESTAADDDIAMMADEIVEKLGLEDIPMPMLHDSSHHMASRSHDSNDSKNDLDGSFASLSDDVILEDLDEDGPDEVEVEPLKDPAASIVKETEPSSRSGRKPKPKRNKDKPTTKKIKSKSVPIMSAHQLAPDFQYVTVSEEKYFNITDPRKKVTQEEKQQSKSRRSAISETLAGMGIDSDDEYQLF